MSNDERRTHKRKRVMFGAQASVQGKATKLNCVVRNFSDTGASIEHGSILPLPEDIALTIGRKRRSYKAKVVWSRANTAGVQFLGDAPSVLPDTELEERLRRSERQTRKLRNRVRELTGHA